MPPSRADCELGTKRGDFRRAVAEAVSSSWASCHPSQPSGHRAPLESAEGIPGIVTLERNVVTLTSVNLT